MKEEYNSHIIIYTNCRSSDLPKLRSRAALLKAVTKVSQVVNGKKVEVEVSGLYRESIEAMGLSVNNNFDVKMVIRNPEANYEDVYDQRSLFGGGGEGGARSPFFFRHDGSTVDLVNLYKNQSAFLVLNGPSTKDLDLEILQAPGFITMGVNNGSHLIRPNLWSCVDEPYRFMSSIWLDPKILKIIPHAHFQKRLLDYQSGKPLGEPVHNCPNVIGYRRNERFSPDTFLTESTVNWGNHGSLGGGRSVMLSSIRLLHLLGFRTIYLVGCDFHMDEKSKYFFEENRDANAIKNNANSYSIMVEYFKKLAPIFEGAGLSVFNLNRESNLKAFPFMSFDEAVVRATKSIVGELDRTTLGMYVKR